MKKIVMLAFVVLLTACPKTHDASEGSGSGSGSGLSNPVHGPAAPAAPVVPALVNAPPVPLSQPAADQCPLARLFASKWGKVLGDCSCWTADSVLCSPSPTALVWCEAKSDAKPHCDIAGDWTPRQAGPEVGAGSAAPPQEAKAPAAAAKAAPPVPPGKK